MRTGMKEISRRETLSILKGHNGQGLRIDERLWTAVLNEDRRFFQFLLRDVPSFLRLIWQSNSETRPLSLVGQARTLKDCAERLESYDWSFKRLAHEHDDWFRRCQEIDHRFDFGRFGYLWVAEPTNGERIKTPNGTFYVYDSNHKAIVLAKKLLRKDVGFNPVGAVLLVPRPNKKLSESNPV